MFVDVNSYVGHWPFRKLTHNTLSAQDKLAQEVGITHMVIANLNAIFYKDSMQGNMELLEELNSYDGKTVFLPAAVINPTYVMWKEDMARCVKELGFRCIELCPTYHGYSLKNEGAEAIHLAGDLGVPVRICCEFENIRQQHKDDVHCNPDLEDLAIALDRSPSTTLLLTCSNPHLVPERLEALVKCRSNIYFDISRIDTFMHQSLEWSIDKFGFDHFCFGTLSPFYYMDAALVRLHYGPGTETEKAAMRWKNASKIWSLQ